MQDRRYPSDSSVLRPRTPADHADLFAMLEAELSEEFTASLEDVIQPLALLGVRHLAGHRGLRCLIHGESGVGKTTAAKVLAGLLGVPFCRLSLTETAETTWRGADIPNQIDALRRGLIRPGVSVDSATLLASQSIVLVDDMDVMRVEPYGSYGDSDRGQRAGRQQSLLSLWSGEPMPIGEADWTWHTETVLVIGAGEFHGIEPPMDAAGLVRRGLSAPLAERLASGSLIHVPALTAPDLARVACREAQRLSISAFEAFGYPFRISMEAAHQAVTVARRRGADAGVRGVVGLLRRSADRLLIRMICAEAAPIGTAVVLAPDDL
jgi:hypothetical protein